MKNVVKKRFNPARFFRGMGLVLMLTFTMMIFIKGSATGTLQTEYKQIIVKRGDTIWAIARQNKNNESGMDEVIYAIKEANSLNNSNLYPGQVLKVPLNL